MSLFVTDLIVAGISLAIIAAFTVALRTHFRSPSTPGGMLLIIAASVATAFTFTTVVMTHEQPSWAQIAGIALEFLGAALFYAAVRASRSAALLLAFDKGAPTSIVSQGPYRYIRHPFYVAYLLFWVGFALCGWSVLGLPLLAILLALYVTAALGEEAKFRQTPLAAAYEEYRRRTGFFLPRLTRS